MSKASFISRVMQIMNELGWDDLSAGSFFGSNSTKVEGHIEAVFVDSWRKAVSLFPKTYFDKKDFSGNELVGDVSTGVGYVVLPADFYTLFTFKMKGWQKGVETIYAYSDPIASVQANEYTRGNIVRPVVLRNTKPIPVLGSVVLKEVLEYYSLPKGKTHEIEEAVYIPLIQPLSDATILDAKLIDPLAHLCAAQVYFLFEKPEIAKVLEVKATEIIQ